MPASIFLLRHLRYPTEVGIPLLRGFCAKGIFRPHAQTWHQNQKPMEMEKANGFGTGSSAAHCSCFDCRSSKDNHVPTVGFLLQLPVGNSKFAAQGPRYPGYLQSPMPIRGGRRATGLQAVDLLPLFASWGGAWRGQPKAGAGRV